MCRRNWRSEAFGNGANGHEEHRREKETEKADTEHSRKHGYAHRTPHLGSGAGCQDERHDTHDEGKGRHENWAQSELRRVERCGHTISASGALALVSKLHDEDRVLT